MNKLEIEVGENSLTFAKIADEERITRQNQRSSLGTLEARLKKKREILEQKSFFQDNKELLYGPGIAD